MTAEQFCYWLQGFFEITGELQTGGLTPNQVEVVKDHLKLVLDKKTPDRSGGGSGGGRVLNEDELRRVVIATRPGMTCSHAVHEDTHFCTGWDDKYSDWGGKH